MDATQTAPRTRSEHRRGNPQELAVGVGLGLFSLALGLAEIVAPRRVARMVGMRDNTAPTLRACGVREVVAGIGLLSAPRAPAWRWFRVAGDLMDLALLGSAAKDRVKATRTAMAVLGVTAVDLAAGASGERTSLDGAPDGKGPVRASVTIDRSPEECYARWSDPAVLERVMTLVESVRATGENRTHWTARMGKRVVEWDAEYTERIPNTRLAWSTPPESRIRTSGSVRFDPAPGGRGCVVRLEMTLPSGGGLLGRVKARKDLQRFKQFMEVGFIPSAEGPSGRRGVLGKLLEKAEDR